MRRVELAAPCLRLEVPEFAVVADSVVVRLDAVGIEQFGLMTLAKVPVKSSSTSHTLGPSTILARQRWSRRNAAAMNLGGLVDSGWWCASEWCR